jgi:hypothetical protein
MPSGMRSCCLNTCALRLHTVSMEFCRSRGCWLAACWGCYVTKFEALMLEPHTLCRNLQTVSLWFCFEEGRSVTHGASTVLQYDPVVLLLLS